MSRAGAVLLAAAAVVGCSHAPPAPADALGTFGAAVERQDWNAAYGVMSASYRKRVTLTEFRKLMESSAADSRDSGRSLRENAARWGSRVELVVGSDERVGLVREAGGWRLEKPPFEPFAQDTPRAALRTFIRAVESRRYDILVDLAPARYRADITPEKLRTFWQTQGEERTRTMLRDLRLALDGRIVEEGDEAFLAYGTGRQVRFIREDGLWRIETPE